MKCSHCKTQLQPEEMDARISGGKFHYYCAARMTAGSVGHQLRQCRCFVMFGDAKEDPPNMTKQEAAIAAYFLFVGRSLPLAPHVWGYD